jgi:dTDP-4-dehydrorhamnose reductase
LKVLVIGAGGQVGAKVARLAHRKGHSVVGTYRSRAVEESGIETLLLDKTDRARVEEVLQQHRPQVVIDTGALHNVDYCESHPEEAMAVNRDGTRWVAAASQRAGARFVMISTDYVFDGLRTGPYSETDAPGPASVYARSKLEGEQAAISENPDTVVARPSVIYSWVPLASPTGSASGKPLNFASWFLRQLLEGKEVRIVTDQIASPTLADDLARALLALAESSVTGVFHAAGATPLSRYDFCRRLGERLGFPSEHIVPIDSAALRQAAPRPPNSSLSSEKLRRAVGYSMQEIGLALDEMQRSMVEDPGLPAPLRDVLLAGGARPEGPSSRAAMF